MDLKHKETILRLLAEHRITTIATVRPGWPQATTVGYANKMGRYALGDTKFLAETRLSGVRRGRPRDGRRQP